MNYQITDKQVYRTTNWTIESENDTYYVQCQEEDFGNVWYIRNDEDDDIDIHSELGIELIKMCQAEDTE